ncbi:MAG: hypothetical protein ACP5UA_13255 [Candidatus Hydrogenedens sp.]
MSKKVIQIRKDALFISSLYLIPVFIVSGVLAVDLYINVQRWHYDYLTIQAKKNITRWVKDKSEFKKHDKLKGISKDSKGEPSIEPIDNKETKDIRSISFFSKILDKIVFFRETEEENQTQEEGQNVQKVEDINYGLQAMMAEIEMLKVEKVRLENLQNLTRLGFQLGLVTPKPEQVVRITYSKDERDKLIQTASSDMLFPQKPKKINTSETKYAEGETDIKQKIKRIKDLLNKPAISIKEWVINKITTPVIAESKNSVNEETNESNVPKMNKDEKNLHPDKNNDDIDIDSLTEFLMEKL